MSDHLPVSLHDRLRARMDRRSLVDCWDELIQMRAAVRAVLDKCAVMRNDTSGLSNGPTHVGHFIAIEFERAIAAALGVEETDDAAL